MTETAVPLEITPPTTDQPVDTKQEDDEWAPKLSKADKKKKAKAAQLATFDFEEPSPAEPQDQEDLAADHGLEDILASHL